MKDYNSLGSEALRKECKDRKLGSESYHGKTKSQMIATLRAHDATSKTTPTMDEIRAKARDLAACMNEYYAKETRTRFMPSFKALLNTVTQVIRKLEAN